MERRVWIRPLTEVQKFEANEYVAACGDENKIYKFTCDAGGGARGDVYTDAGENLTKGAFSYYHACDATHEAPTDDEFIKGYYIQNGGNDQTRYWDWVQWKEYEKVPVIIWTEGGTNVHCTTNLEMNTWPTAKS